MKDTLHYIRTLCRFVLLGLLVGLVCGAVGTVFYHAIALAPGSERATPGSCI